MDCRTLLLLTLIYFTGDVVTASVSIPAPSPSGDVLTSEGASFSFSCWMHDAPPDGWFLQVLKLKVVVPSFTGDNIKPGEDMITETYNFMISTETQLDPSLPRDVAARYIVSRYGDYGVIVHVTDAVASDSGQWACRVTSENSSSSAVDFVINKDGSNITVLTPVLNMRLFEADDVSTWQPTRRYVTDHVTLNAEEHKIFGCEVWINMGVPELTGFWDDGSDKDQIDTSKWHIEGGDHRVFDVFDWHVRANSSGLLWTRTQDIPDVGSRNGTAFSCEATLPVIGTRQTNITVFSSTPPLNPEVDDGGNSATSLVSQLLVATISALVTAVYCS